MATNAKHRMFTAISALSLVLLLALVATLPFSSQWESPSEPIGFRVWGSLRVSALDGSFYVFNRDWHYTGSILEMARGDERRRIDGFDGGWFGWSKETAHDSAKWVQLDKRLRWPGVHYHYLSFRDGADWWTLGVSRVWPIMITAVLPVVWLVIRLRRPRTPPSAMA